MTRPLEGLSVVEGSAFVAAPSGGMTLAQLGADVIRFDRIGGGLDHRRWPLTADGVSLYWNGLNRGKRSVAADLSDPEVRDLLSELVARAGNFLTNFPSGTTIQTNTGALTIATGGGDGDINVAPNGTGSVAVGHSSADRSAPLRSEVGIRQFCSRYDPADAAGKRRRSPACKGTRRFSSVERGSKNR